MDIEGYKIEIVVDGRLNENERAVIKNVARKTEERLLIGLQEYGPLEFEGEKGKVEYWARQLGYEVDDMATYVGIIQALKDSRGSND
jgi:hypothetical protein